MSLRVSQTPWGLARFTYAYLAGLLAGLIAGLVALAVSPLADAAPVCRDDLWGFCYLGLILLGALVGLALGLFLMAFVFRLSWEWAAWTLAVVLVVTELVTQSSQLGLVWLMALAPGVAAALSFQRPDRELAPSTVWGRRGLLGLVVLQFLVWLTILLT